MTIQVTSSTDSPEAVLAAMGKSAPPPSPTPADETSSEEKEVDNKESESEESEAVVEETSAENSETEEEEQETQEPEDKPKKKPGGFQKKIDKLTRRINEVQQKAEFWRNKAGGTQTAAPAPEITLGDPPSGKPDPAKFDTHAAYVEALTDWKVGQKLASVEKERQDRDAAAQRKASVEKWMERADNFRDSVDDFDEVLAVRVTISPVMQEAIITSDVGPQIAYHLGKNPKEAARLANLSPVHAARELGRLEAKFLSSKAPAKSVNPTIAAKPNPPTPVKGNAATAEKSPDQMSYQEYKAWRAKQRS